MTVGTLAADTPRTHSRPIESRFAWSEAVKLLGILLQLALAILVVRQFQLDSSQFNLVLELAVGGFVVNALLPQRYRLAWFTALSLGGLLLVLGATGLWLLGIGLVLIGICHLPLDYRLRLGIMGAAVAVLIAMRAGWLPCPWPVQLWPILASMFMFRMVIYLYDLKHDTKEISAPRTLAYFFMLPNLTFPLFPVVDYKAFERTWYDADPWAIYQRGARWIARGILHLLLYRLVYYYATLDPTEVHSGADLVQYIFTTFLLYLRVSGQFHLVVGILHLFGFRLPETNHHYLLSFNFIEVWRRTNIYWKDFMMKVFYYPAWFRLRQKGASRAIVLAMSWVFVVTWALHSVQWFWFQGELLLSGREVVFYTILGALMIRTSLQEAAKGRQRTLAGTKTDRWSLRRAGSVVLTMATLTTLWSFWTAESVGSWLSIWPAALHWTPSQVLVVLGGIAVYLAIAGWNWDAKAVSEATGGSQRLAPALGSTAFLAGLFLIGQPGVYERLSPDASDLLVSLEENRLNKRDEATLTRGYYEKVDDKNQAGRLWEVNQGKPADWISIEEMPIYLKRDDFIGTALAPRSSITLKGAPLSTNQWGMRDRDYDQRKAPGAWRAALLGPSDAMGTGVGDGQTFEAVLEDRLNQARPVGGVKRYEVLNFSLSNRSIMQQVAALEQQVLAFQPDVAFLVMHPQEEGSFTSRYLAAATIKGVTIPYPELREMAGRVGIVQGMDRDEARVRAEPLEEDLVRWGLTHFAEIARSHGVTPVLLVMDLPNQHSKRAQPLVDFARTQGMLVFDIRSVYLGRDQRDIYIAPWDRHPNATGHRLVADRLFDLIVSNQDSLHFNGARTPVASTSAEGSK